MYGREDLGFCLGSSLSPYLHISYYSGICLERGGTQWTIQMWSLKTGGLWWQVQCLTLKYRTSCQEYLTYEGRWSFMAVVPQDRFHCLYSILISSYQRPGDPSVYQTAPTLQAIHCGNMDKGWIRFWIQRQVPDTKASRQPLVNLQSRTFYLYAFQR